MITDSQRQMMARVLGKTEGKTLKRGARGVTVRALQLYLRDQGFDIKADGVFGKNTEAALKQMQGKAGIGADGRAGSKTFGTIRSTLSVPTPTPRPEPATLTGSATVGGSNGAVSDKPVTMSPVAPPTLTGTASIGSGAAAVPENPGPVKMTPELVPPPAGFSDPSTFDPRPAYETMVPQPGAGSLGLPIAEDYRNSVRAKEYANAQDLTNALGMAVRQRQMQTPDQGTPSPPQAPSLRDALLGVANNAQMTPQPPAPPVQPQQPMPMAQNAPGGMNQPVGFPGGPQYDSMGQMLGAGMGAIGNAIIPQAQGGEMDPNTQALIRALLMR